MRGFLERLGYALFVLLTIPLAPIAFVFWADSDDSYADAILMSMIFLGMVVGVIPYMIVTSLWWLFTGHGLGWLD